MDAAESRASQHDANRAPGPRLDNPDHASAGEGYSLALAEADLRPGTLVAFGDIVLKRRITQALLEEAGAGIPIAVDSALAGAAKADRVLVDHADTGRFSLENVHLRAISDTLPPGTSARVSDLLSRVLARGRPVRVVYHRGGWVNVDDLADLVDASGL